MSKIIGIDLGTTFSAIAQLDDLGNPEVLASTDSNKKITASAVYIKNNSSKAIYTTQQPSKKTRLFIVSIIYWYDILD